MIKKPALTLIRGQRSPFADVPVANIDSYAMCEDGRTLLVLVELVNGRTMAFTFCPGQAITACAVA